MNVSYHAGVGRVRVDVAGAEAGVLLVDVGAEAGVLGEEGRFLKVRREATREARVLVAGAAVRGGQRRKQNMKNSNTVTVNIIQTPWACGSTYLTEGHDCARVHTGDDGMWYLSAAMLWYLSPPDMIVHVRKR